MITPQKIKEKATKQYPKFRKAWLKGEMFFPHLVRSSKQTDNNLTVTLQAVQHLREGSKEKKGYGYTVEWVERKSRIHGLNKYPDRILFETEEDFLRLIGKKKEFAQFCRGVDTIRQRYPQLVDWIQSNPKKFQDVTHLVHKHLSVIDYFIDNPRPNLFARELPLSVDTKFIEQNKSILGSWFEVLLPADSIAQDEHHFERRYGLKYARQHILIRFLDSNVQEACNSPWEECSIPIQTVAEMHVDIKNVIIVENKINLLTLPPLPGTLAIGGLGNAVTELRAIKWLHKSALWYWGDIDVDGLTILSRFRKYFPQTISLMMDMQAIDLWQDSLRQTVNQLNQEVPSQLTDSELKAFEICLIDHLRIEQEQIPQQYVNETLKRSLLR